MNMYAERQPTSNLGSGDSSVVKAPDSWWKGRGFESLLERRENFLCWLLFRYPFHPRVTAAPRKRSQSFCQKRRWQVTYVALHEVTWCMVVWCTQNTLRQQQFLHTHIPAPFIHPLLGKVYVRFLLIVQLQLRNTAKRVSDFRKFHSCVRFQLLSTW